MVYPPYPSLTKGGDDLKRDIATVLLSLHLAPSEVLPGCELNRTIVVVNGKEVP
jgi:hypothetical protein